MRGIITFSTLASLDVFNPVVNSTSRLMSEKTNKLFKGLRKGLGGVRLRVQEANLFRSRSPSPSPSPRKAADGTANDMDAIRATSVSSNRNPHAEAVECESLPSRPRENSETRNPRPRSPPPSQTVTPFIMINNGQAVESGGTSSLAGNRGPQSPNQEWLSLLPPVLISELIYFSLTQASQLGKLSRGWNRHLTN